MDGYCDRCGAPKAMYVENPYCMINEETNKKRYFLMATCEKCGFTSLYDLAYILGKDWHNNTNDDTTVVKTWD